MTSPGLVLPISMSVWRACCRFSCGFAMGAPDCGWWIVASRLDDPTVTEPATRVSWRFAEDGHSVACTVVSPSGPPVLELWQLTPAGPTERTLIPVPSLGPHSQLVPLSPGRILVCHHRGGGQQIDLVTGAGHPTRRCAAC